MSSSTLIIIIVIMLNYAVDNFIFVHEFQEMFGLENILIVT